MGQPGYSAEFRRKVLDLLAAGRSVAGVAHDLDVSDQTIYNWRRQDRVDRGLQSGLTTAETAELATAKKRIAELETELALAQKAVDLLKEETSPKGGTRRSQVIAAQNRPVQVACRVLGVSESGFYEQRKRPPSERAVRHALLTDLITRVHARSHGTYGCLRVHAELTMGQGVQVGHDQVGLLMRRAGLQGATGRRKFKRIRPDTIATDLVERTFARSGPNQLWVTDLVRHVALFDRVEVKDLHGRVVAAGRWPRGWSLPAESRFAVTSYSPNPSIYELYDELGAEITNILASVSRRTAAERLETAAAMLRIDLARSGVEANLEWCCRALETIRRGEELTVDLV